MKRKKRLGFSLLEVMLGTTVLAMVMTGATALMVNLIRSMNNTSSQVDVDQSTSTALQKVSRDLQEAKQVSIITSSRIRIYYPEKAADGTYIKTALDNVNTVEFYRGNLNGTVNANGTALVRKPANGPARVLCKNVIDVQFASNNPSSVAVTVKAEKTAGTAKGRAEMVHRAIFLRNY